MSEREAVARRREFRRNERDEYAVVCQAARTAVQRLLETSEGRQVTRYVRAFLGVLEFTAFYSKTWDAVYLEQLVAAARIAGDYAKGEFLGKHAADALHLLAERGVIVYEPATNRRQKSLIGLPSSEVAQLPLLASVNRARDSAQGEPQTPFFREPLSPPQPGLSGSPPEKFPEKGSDDIDPDVEKLLDRISRAAMQKGGTPLTPSQRAEGARAAGEDRAGVQEVADHATASDQPAARFLTLIRARGHILASAGKADRAERFVRNGGWQYADYSLAEELDQLFGVDSAERERLLILAARLRGDFSEAA